MSIIIKSGAAADLLSVDSDGSAYITTPTTASNAGFASLVSEADSGSVTGERKTLAAEVNEDFNLRIGSENLIFWNNFNGSGQWDYFKWKFEVSTMSNPTCSGGFITMNSGGATAAGNYCMVNSWQTHVRFLPTQNLYLQFRAKVSNGKTSGKQAHIGFQYYLNSAKTIPSDGPHFLWDVDGTLKGICVFGSGAQPMQRKSVNLPMPTDDETHLYMMVVMWNKVEYWIDNVLCGTIETVGPLPFRSQGGYFYSSVSNLVATAGAFKLAFGNIVISQGSSFNSRPWPETKAANYSLGFASGDPFSWSNQGTQNNNGNSTAHGAATLSNNAAPSGGYTGTTLGGDFRFASINGATTDLIAFAYLVPAGTVAVEARTLFITDIQITTNTEGAAFDATTGTVLQWALGVGSTAVDLATTDGTAARQTRRIPLGQQSWSPSSARGTPGQVISWKFKTPLIVEQGTYLHVIAREILGVNTASLYYRGIVSINGYWE